MKSLQRFISDFRVNLEHGALMRSKTSVSKTIAPYVAPVASARFIAQLQTFFLHNKLASISMLFAFVMPATVGTASLSMDYANISYAKGKLQAAMASSIQAGLQTALREIVDTSTSSYDPTNDALSRGFTSAKNTFLNNLGIVPNLTLNSVTPAIWRDGQTLRATMSYTATMATPMWAMYGTPSVILSNSNLSEVGFPQVADGTYTVNEDFSSITSNFQYGTWGLFSSVNNWKSNNGAVEVDHCSKTTGCSVTLPPNGQDGNIVELDSVQNSALSKRVYLAAGSFELRYYYASRIGYPSYDPAYICGSSNTDLANYNAKPGGLWAGWNNLQTNRLEVYLDPAPTDTPPYDPASGTSNLMSPTNNNMIDACVYSGGVRNIQYSLGGGAQAWIQRSVPITVTMQGYYWLTFQAAGASDGYGPLIDNIQLCPNICPGSVQENYPWTPGQQLFKDNFTTPYTNSNISNCASGAVNCGNWNNGSWYDGTLDSSGTNTGWTSLDAGWQTSPWNQTDFNQVSTNNSWGFPTGATPAGNHTAIDLDASNYARTISRKFLLDPGYYEIDYSYAQRVAFFPALTGSYCASQTDVTSSSSQLVNSPNGYATNAVLNTAYIKAGSPQSTNNGQGIWMDVVELAVDPDLLVSHPVTSPQFYGVTTYQNPDGTSASLPSAQPVNGSLISTYSLGPDGKSLPYLPTASGVVDACFYAAAPLARKVPIKITKSGYYWVSFAAGDNPTGFYSNGGAVIADVALYALGGLSTGNTNSATKNGSGQVMGTDGVYRTPNVVRAPAPKPSLFTETVSTSSLALSGYQIAYSGTALGFIIPAQ